MDGGRQEEGGGGAGERRDLTPRLLTGRSPVILLQSLSVLQHYSFRKGPFKLLSHNPPCEEENGVLKSWSNMRRSSKRFNTVVSVS